MLSFELVPRTRPNEARIFLIYGEPFEHIDQVDDECAGRIRALMDNVSYAPVEVRENAQRN